MSAMKAGRRIRTRTKIATYAFLSIFALIVIMPFVIAFGVSFKEADDVFNYPPSILPQTQRTTTVAGIDDELPVYTFDDDRSGEWAVVESSVSVGIYVEPDVPDVEYSFEPDEVTETEATVEFDGDVEPVVIAEVDGATLELVRVRGATAARFQSLESGEQIVEQVRAATPEREFGARATNYSDVLDLQSLDRSLTNTVLVTVLVVVGQVFTSVMGGYAFARLHFNGRDKLFLIYLGSVMIPFVVLIIPLYQLMVDFGWVDNLSALVIPFVFTPVGTFLMRQFFISIPKELEEAALIDGASRWRILWQIFVPLARPAIATLSTFAFLYAWNSFVWPLVIINSGSTDNFVLSLALQQLGGRSAESVNLVFAGVVIAMLPPIIVFLAAQRHFVENAASTGLK